MPLIATPEIDVSLAQNQWDGFVQSAGEGLDKVVGKGNKLQEQLEDVGDEAKRTAEAVEQIALVEKMEKAVGHIGDVKDILEKAGGAMFGWNEQMTESVVLIGDITEYGAALGSAFGPIGAVVGAGLGAALGVFTDYTNRVNKAKEAQDQLLRETITQSYTKLQQQRALVAANTKTWDDYGLAVRRAGEVQISIIEGVLTATEDSTKAELDAIQLRVDAYAQNVDIIKAQTKGRVRSSQEVADLVKNETGLVRVQSEAYQAQKKALDSFVAKTLPDLKRAFESSDKASEEFEKALAKIGKEPSLKDLQGETKEAEKALKLAQERVKTLKGELGAGPKEEEGFFGYMSRLKVLLIDSQKAADDLKTAQDTLLGTKQAETSKKEQNVTAAGPSFAELAAELNDEQAQAFKDLALSEKQAAEDAAIAGVEAIWAKAEAEEDALNEALVDKLNLEIEYQEKLAALKQEEDAKDYQRQLEAIEREKQLQSQRLDATVAFYNTIQEGARSTGEAIANALAGQAVQAIDSYLDAVANGEKRTKESNKRQRVEFLRKTGSMLITDGTGHVVAGGVKAIAGDPLGLAEAIAGAGEIAVGVGMGGVGALGQKSLGGTQAKVDSQKASGTSIGGGGGGTKTLSTVVVNFQTVTTPSEREQQEIGSRLKSLIAASDRRTR